MNLDLTKDEAYSLADFVAMNIFTVIRDDVDIDSVQWLRNVVHAYEKLCAYSGYVGMTEQSEANDERGER